MADGYALTGHGVSRLREVARIVEGGLGNPNVQRAAGPRSLGGGTEGAIIRVTGPVHAVHIQPGYVQAYDVVTGTFSDAFPCWLRTPNNLAIDPSGNSRVTAIRIAGAVHDNLPIYVSVCC